MRLNTSTVKQLCSTDEIEAEKKYKDPFKYVPTHTMIIARLVERIKINHDYEVEIKFRISVEQYMRIAA